MRVRLLGAVCALVVVLGTLTLTVSAQGKSPIADVQQRVQVLESQVQALQQSLQQQSSALTASLSALTANLSALNAQLASLAAEVDAVSQSANNANGAVASLQNRVSALESALANSLSSYDQLGGRSCTTSFGAPGTVSFTGIFKSAICAVATNGRYINLGPVVVDTRTNLMWETKNHSGGLHDVGNSYTWCQATGSTALVCAGNPTSWIGQVNTEAFGGFTDWRIPTLAELQTSFIDTHAPNCGGNGPFPCVNPVMGPAAFGLHWSSTDFPGQGFAWLANTFLGGATVHPETALFAPDGPFVRAVRTY